MDMKEFMKFLEMHCPSQSVAFAAKAVPSPVYAKRKTRKPTIAKILCFCRMIMVV